MKTKSELGGNVERPAETSGPASTEAGNSKQYILVSDLAEDQSVDSIVPETTENFAEAMKEGLDLVTRDVISAGTNVQYASTSASRGAVGSGQYLSLAELRKGKRTLLSFNAKTAEDGKFVCITHPHCLYDLEGDSNITNITVAVEINLN